MPKTAMGKSRSVELARPEKRIDYNLEPGARLLAANLHQYWRRQGAKNVKFEVISLPGLKDGGYTIFCIKSNLQNGLPPR